MLFGGYRNKKSAWSFSLTSQQWTRLPNLPNGKWKHGTVVINKYAYIVGGMYNNTIDRYDRSTKTFQTVNTMQKPRCYFGICSFKNDILIAGGV